MRLEGKRLFLPLLAAALLAQTATTAPARQRGRAAAGQQRSGAAAALHKLFDDEWEWTMREFPTFASSLGDRRYNDRWEDASLESVERRHRHRQEALGRLRSIDRS